MLQSQTQPQIRAKSRQITGWKSNVNDLSARSTPTVLISPRAVRSSRHSLRSEVDIISSRVDRLLESPQPRSVRLHDQDLTPLGRGARLNGQQANNMAQFSQPKAGPSTSRLPTSNGSLSHLKLQPQIPPAPHTSEKNASPLPQPRSFSVQRRTNDISAYTAHIPREQISNDDLTLVDKMYSTTSGHNKVSLKQASSDGQHSTRQVEVTLRGGFGAHRQRESLAEGSGVSISRNHPNSSTSPKTPANRPENGERSERVEDPDGVFKTDMSDAGIEFTGQNRTNGSPRVQAHGRQDNGRESSNGLSGTGSQASKPLPSGHAKKRPMQTKAGQLVAVSSHMSDDFVDMSICVGRSDKGDGRKENWTTFERDDTFLISPVSLSARYSRHRLDFWLSQSADRFRAVCSK